LQRCVAYLSGKADADDFGAAKATLKGLKTRYQNTGIAPIFIHTVRINGWYSEALIDACIFIN
jgi:hypothetical protein